MKKQQDKQVVNDINSFDKEASIYKILFQDRATSLLKHIIDKITIDRYEQVNFKLPSILIAGKEGKQLIAQAFSNSMCSDLELIQGEALGMGGFSGSIYKNIDTETTYYISSADELSPYSASLFHEFLSRGYVQFRDRIKGEDVIVSANNKLFMFGVDDSKKMSHDLFKSIDYHCYLKNNSTSETEILIEQRLTWCEINYEEQIPAIISHNGSGSISNSMRLLSLCYLIMRGNGRTKMRIKDVEIGIGLDCTTGRIDPPPIPDDIPY